MQSPQPADRVPTPSCWREKAQHLARSSRGKACMHATELAIGGYGSFKYLGNRDALGIGQRLDPGAGGWRHADRHLIGSPLWLHRALCCPPLGNTRVLWRGGGVDHAAQVESLFHSNAFT